MVLHFYFVPFYFEKVEVERRDLLPGFKFFWHVYNFIFYGQINAVRGLFDSLRCGYEWKGCQDGWL